MAKKETYTAKKWTEALLTEELIKRGFDEADIADLTISDKRDQLILDDENVDDQDVDSEDPTTVDTDDSDEDDQDVDSEDPDPGFKASTKAVHIVKGREYIRTYSEKEHGKDFKKLADQFLAHKGEEYSVITGFKKLTISHRAKTKEGVFTTISTDVYDTDEARRHFLNIDANKKPQIIITY